MSPYFFLTYDECRRRFRHLARRLGATVETHPIEARGPEGQALSVDVTRLGDERPERVLVILSGTHGVEGFAGSAIQQQLLAETAAGFTLPRGCAILLIHALNPWGFAWWRRQNESNVDLNRNWVDHGSHGITNPGYDELHDLLCPRDEIDASEQAFLDRASHLLQERGFAWFKESITRGQYDHPDGIYYGGTRREASTRILARVFEQHVAGASEALCLDLHTGHGEFGSYTLLSNHAEDSPEHGWLAGCFDPARLEVTIARTDPVTPDKVGQLARGVAQRIPRVSYRSLTFELGTFDDTRMILAELREHWLHCHGDRESELGRQIAWEHHRCSIPDSEEWQSEALAHGRRVLGDAMEGLFGSRPD